jgi:hypothetical protein
MRVGLFSKLLNTKIRKARLYAISVRITAEDNIKMDLQEVGWGGGMDWIDVAQDRDRWRALVSAVMNLWVP